MKSAQKLLPIIKLALLAGLCLYILPSSLLVIYLQIQFLEPSYFPKILIQILAVNTVFLLNLFFSAEQLFLPERKTPRAESMICAVIGCIMFLCLALHTQAIYDWFFFLCTLAVVGLSVRT